MRTKLFWRGGLAAFVAMLLIAAVAGFICGHRILRPGSGDAARSGGG